MLSLKIILFGKSQSFCFLISLHLNKSRVEWVFFDEDGSVDNCTVSGLFVECSSCCAVEYAGFSWSTEILNLFPSTSIVKTRRNSFHNAMWTRCEPVYGCSSGRLIQSSLRKMCVQVYKFLKTNGLLRKWCAAGVGFIRCISLRNGSTKGCGSLSISSWSKNSPGIRSVFPYRSSAVDTRMSSL